MTIGNSVKKKPAKFHRHNAILVLQKDVVAVTPKQNDPRCCIGDVHKCQCGAMVFFPHTLGLYPVEVEMAIERENENSVRAA